MAAKAFNGTKNPPSGTATRPIAIYPDTTGDAEARRMLRVDVDTVRVAPSKSRFQPSTGGGTTGRQVSGGARISGGNP